MTQKSTRTKRISITVTPEAHDQIVEVATRSGVSVNVWCAMALSEVASRTLRA